MTETERPDPAALRRLLAAGTRQPWTRDGNGELRGADGWFLPTVTDDGLILCRQDAELIVAAVNALVALLDRLEAAEAALARQIPITLSTIWIDQRPYEPTSFRLTGRDLRALADVSEGRDLWAEMPGLAEDRLIPNEERVDLGQFRLFFTAPREINASAALAGAGEGKKVSDGV